MPHDREHLLLTAREAVTAGMRVPAGEQRMLAALEVIRDDVCSCGPETIWVALIEHSIDTIRPFLAVYADELPISDRPRETCGPAADSLPLDPRQRRLRPRQRGRLHGGCSPSTTGSARPP